MTTDGACFILEEYITILLPMAWDDGKLRSMIHTLGMYNHVLYVL